MANKAISELPQALNVNNQDLFVLEQSGIAKKLTAETFITEQGIIDALAEALDGHGGISSVTLSSVSGRIRTYRITFTDQSATTFQVYDGTSIDRISRTSSSGLDDVYTIFLSDGTTTFFTVHNGADGTVSEAMLNDALKDKAPAITETTESSAIANFTDGADDMPLHNILAEINPVQDLTYGDPYPAGGGVNKFDGSAVTTTHSSNWGIDWNATTNVLTITQKTSYTTGTPTFSLNLPSGTYVASYQSISETGKISLYTDGSWAKSLNNGVTFTLDSTKTNEIRFAAVTVTKFQLESGSTATAYSPYSNICPITGWTGCNVTRTGKNLIDDTKHSEVYYNTIAIGQTEDRGNNQRKLFLKAGTYYLTVNASSTVSAYIATDYISEYRIGNNGGAFTITEDTNACIYIYKSGLQLSDYQSAMLELGSTATTYEPYITPSTVSLSWQTEAGTVYGGTVDVATGLLTVDMAMVDLGTLTWQYNSGNNRFDGSTISSSKRWPNPLVTPNAVCECLKTVSFNNLYQGADNAIAFDTRELRARCTTFGTNADAFKTAVTGQSLVYELATPQTYQLTPQQLMTLLGTNNVWADTGDTTVTYVADAKMFIEKLTMPTEDDLVANQAITSGKYFMIGNSLYLALANIASGAQITIGTNAQRVSLADALNTINS